MDHPHIRDDLPIPETPQERRLYCAWRLPSSHPLTQPLPGFDEGLPLIRGAKGLLPSCRGSPSRPTLLASPLPTSIGAGFGPIVPTSSGLRASSPRPWSRCCVPARQDYGHSRSGPRSAAQLSAQTPTEPLRVDPPAAIAPAARYRAEAPKQATSPIRPRWGVQRAHLSCFTVSICDG